MRKLPKAVQAMLAQMPETIRLDVCRYGPYGTETGHKIVLKDFQEFRLNQPGSWRCVAASRYSVHWGLGKTATEALQNCRKAGGQFGRNAELVLEWQPNVAWEEHGKLYPKRASEVGPMTADSHWGSPRPVLLWKPGFKRVAQRHLDWLAEQT